LIHLGGLAQAHPSLEAHIIDIDQVHPHPDNPRNGDTDTIRDSIETNGLYRPIYARTDGTILAGNHTYAAALELGATRLPVIHLDVDDEQATRIMLVDNRAADLGRYDDALLLELLNDLDQTPHGLAGTGYDALAVQDITDALARAEHTPLLPGDHPTLADRFIVPPFTVLDARSGPWQDRKHQWLALGIRSEIGRTAVAYKDQDGLDDIKGAAYRPGTHMGSGPTGQSLRDNPLQYGQRHRNPTAKSYTDGDGGTSIFDPVVCELVYRWFAPPHAHVLDPFAGGSVRGITAAALGHTYTGIELRTEQIAANQQQAADILPYVTGNPATPTWVAGDSRDILPDLRDQADLIFTCPPYADLEKYSDDPADLSAMRWPDFLAAYRAIIAAAADHLADDRYAVWVIGDVRDKRTGTYRNLVGETVRAFTDAGLWFYNEAILVTPPGSLPLRTGAQFTASRKLGKTHQNVLVFVKGDGAAAARACGPVRVTLPTTV